MEASATSAKKNLYLCKSKGAAPREEWTAFKLEEVSIRRLSSQLASITKCQCAMCHTASYKPIGVKGDRKVARKPVINPSGSLMECEMQEKVVKKGKGVCEVCLQITGRGIRHKCTNRERRAGQVGRGRSTQRQVGSRRKRNLSVLVGMEANDAQEQIVSSALQRVRERKGDSFRLKSASGGGVKGEGVEFNVGRKVEEMPIEVFKEIKKILELSKNKMEKMCRIMRKSKVKMTPNVRAKLKEMDHLLDTEYETIRIKVKETQTFEVENCEKTKSGKKKKKTGKVKKEKRVVEVEKDVTLLKDTKGFLNRLADERNLWKPDIMNRISIDKGDNSLKVIVNQMDRNRDPEITFTRTEKPGNLCSGVKRSIIVAYIENVSEDYGLVRTILELLQVDDLDFVVAADLKLLNVLMGLSGHGGKYACIYCEGEKGLEAGQMRTFSRLLECNKRYRDRGSKVKDMQNFFNVVNLPLLKMEQDQEVLEAVPPPELHMLMGAVNHKAELIRSHLEDLGVEKKLWEWCDGKGVTRRGYNGANKFDGNNASRFIKHAAKLKDEEWWPEVLSPVLECLKAFEAVKDATFSWELEEGWEEKISDYTSMYAELQEYSASVLGLELTVTWKIHIICCHLSDFLSKVSP